MKKLKLQNMYFPLALALSLSPMVFKTIYNEAKPQMIGRGLASVSPNPDDKKLEGKKGEKKIETEVELKKYDKEEVAKRAEKISLSIAALDKKIQESDKKASAEEIRELSKQLNSHIKQIVALERLETSSNEDKKALSEKTELLKQEFVKAENHAKLVIPGEKIEEKKAVEDKKEIVVKKEEESTSSATHHHKDEKVKEDPKDKKEVAKKDDKKDEAGKCEFEDKYVALSKQVETLSANQDKFLSVMTNMTQLMMMMSQQQRNPYTYSFGPNGPMAYPYHYGDGQMGQWGGGSRENNMNTPYYQAAQYGQQGSQQVSGYGNNTYLQPQQPAGYDPRYIPMNVMPGQFGDAPFMQNFESLAPSMVNTGRAPAVVQSAPQMGQQQMGQVPVVGQQRPSGVAF